MNLLKEDEDHVYTDDLDVLQPDAKANAWKHHGRQWDKTLIKQ